MLYPSKLEAVLKTLERWKHRLVFAPKAATRMVRTSLSAGKPRRSCQTLDSPLKGLKNTEFQLQAPDARSVKLAADFTDWEISPLDLIRSASGVWFTLVPLLPGSYAYRFIVDGQWQDDPQAACRIANPFGTSNVDDQRDLKILQRMFTHRTPSLILRCRA